MTSSVFRSDVLSGLTALVTGGASGINRGISEALGRHGARLFLISRNEERLQRAAAEMTAQGMSVGFAVCDVRDPKLVEAAVAACAARFGGLDVLVNGAAGNFLSPAAALSPNGFKTVVDIDLNGTFNACRTAFPLLSASKSPCIINVTATLHYGATALMLHASAAKAGVNALTRNLAVEWGPLGIRVNGIAPGPIDGTEGMARLAPGKIKETIQARIPLRRFGSVDDIGHAAVFLASPAAAFISGHTLVVDGGAWMTGRLSLEEMAEA